MSAIFVSERLAMKRKRQSEHLKISTACLLFFFLSFLLPVLVIFFVWRFNLSERY